MKIISHFKDYYDYLIGKYGIDEKVVYERICSTEDSKDRNWVKSGIYKPQHINIPGTIYNFEMIAFCGVIYCCYYYDGKHYFGEEAKDHIPHTIIKRGYFESDIYTSRDLYKAEKYHLKQTTLNDKEECPVLIVGNDGWDNPFAKVKNPKLSDYDFGKMVSPEDCYIKLSTFLSREKQIIDTRTDKQKIVGKGFDHKTSFRNIK